METQWKPGAKDLLGFAKLGVYCGDCLVGVFFVTRLLGTTLGLSGSFCRGKPNPDPSSIFSSWMIKSGPNPSYSNDTTNHLDHPEGMNYLQLTQTLSGSFDALADEVQLLIDRKTVLEHKLRYAHEQVSQNSFHVYF